MKRPRSQEPRGLRVWEGVAVGRQRLTMAGKGASTEELLRGSLPHFASGAAVTGMEGLARWCPMAEPGKMGFL